MSVLLRVAHSHLHSCLWLYCIRVQAAEAVFNYSPVTAFQLQLSLLLMSRSAQPNFFSRPFFSFTFLFRLFSPHVCLPFMPQTFHPLLHPTTITTTTNPHPPIPLFTSLPILRYQSLLGPDKLRVCLSSFSRLLLPALPNLAPPSISPTTQSPLMSEKPVGIQVLLLIIAFTGIPHCLALPWGGKEGRVWKNERDNRVKLCQGWHAHQLASARSGEQNWHMQLSAMRSK